MGVVVGMVATEERKRIQFALGLLATNYLQVGMFGVAGVVGIWWAVKELCRSHKTGNVVEENIQNTVENDKEVVVNESVLNINQQ